MKLFLPLYETFVSVIIFSLDWLIERFNLFTKYQTIILVVGIGLLILAVFSVYLLSRQRGFVNYCKSLNDTGRLRRFLRQQNSINDFTSKKRLILIREFIILLFGTHISTMLKIPWKYGHVFLITLRLRKY